MTKRSFDDSFWGDPFVQGLEKDAKMLFAYLWTNKRCNSAGLYETTIKTISFETGIAEAEIPNLFKSLQKKVKWLPEHNVVWVKNFLRHQPQSPLFLKAVSSCLQGVSANGLIKEFLDYNAGYGITISYQYPINTVTDGYSYPPDIEQDIDKDKELDKEPTKDGTHFPELPSTVKVVKVDDKTLTVGLVDDKKDIGLKAREVFALLDQLRGYRPPKRAAENKAVLQMLKTYTPNQIIETWQHLKAEPFWQKRELYMMSVQSQIGAYLTGAIATPNQSGEVEGWQ